MHDHKPQEGPQSQHTFWSLHSFVLLDGSFTPLTSNLKSLLPHPRSQSMTLFPTALTKWKQPEENVHRPTAVPPWRPGSSPALWCLPTIAINDYPVPVYPCTVCYILHPLACTRTSLSNSPLVLSIFSFYCVISINIQMLVFLMLKDCKPILDFTSLFSHSLLFSSFCSKTP